MNETQTEPDEGISNVFLEQDFKYRGIPHELRPRLPKLKITSEIKHAIGQMNRYVQKTIHESRDLSDTCHRVYCAAAAISSVYVKNWPNTEPNVGPGSDKPPWEKRLEKKINNSRAIIGVLYNYLKSANPSKRITNKVNDYAWRLKLRPQDPAFHQKLTVHLDTLKQKISALGNRLRRYRIRSRRYRENSLFARDQKKFYRSIEPNKNENHEITISQDELTQYWSKIWERAENHEEDAECIRKIENGNARIPNMMNTRISAEDLRKATSVLKNWAAPGVDGIYNFWWKSLTGTREVLAAQFRKALENPTSIPPFMTLGITYMLPKSENLGDPKNYRPITCLPSIYKIFTSVIRTKIDEFLKINKVLAWEQGGCKSRSKGCKELLIVDSIISRQVKTKRRKLSVAWIDYQKAFDSVPHTWLMKVLRIYKIDPTITKVLEHLMKNWRTTLCLGQSKTREIFIRRGIFQGDGLSLLWFCLALNPLSDLLHDNGCYYNIGGEAKLNHLFYVDDLKLFAKNKQHLIGLLETVKRYSESIKMTMGLDKCAVLHAEGGKVIETENLTLMNGITSFRALHPQEAYRYLGFQEGLTVNDTNNKETAKKEFMNRLKAILCSYLNAKNKITAINTWAVPVVSYTFGVLHWSKTEILELDRRVRTVFTKYRMHHPKSAVERLYLPRAEGGRGLLSFEDLEERERYNLKKYFQSSHLPFYVSLVEHDAGLSLLDLSVVEPVKEKYKERLLARWRSKQIHGRFYSSLNQEVVSQTASNTYLTSGYLFPETEGALHAIQDQVVPTKYYRRHILKQQVDNTKCRLCNMAEETIQHLISGCATLAPKAYVDRHDNMGKVLHQAIAQSRGLVGSNMPYYKYSPQPILEDTETKIYWNTAIITDKTVKNNKPDLVFVEKKLKVCYILDFSVPLDDNIDRAYNEKKNKYEHLGDCIKDQWHIQKIIIMPIIISANGLVHRKTVKHLEEFNLDKGVLNWMQKTVILGTTAIVRRIISSS